MLEGGWRLATIKARGLASPPVPVDVYIDGRLTESYPSVYDCARALRVSCETVKLLLATGRELPASYESITLDIPMNCPYSYRLVTASDGKVRAVVVEDRTEQEGSRV